MAGDVQNKVNGFLSATAFAVSGASAAAPAALPERLAQVYGEPPQVVAQHCTYIDGSGTSSSLIRGRIGEIRSVLERFDLGRHIVADMKNNKVPVCFDQSLHDPNGGGQSFAQYHLKGDVIKVSMSAGVSPVQNAVNISHEWDHRNDGIDFDRFQMNPRSAVQLYRFSECGAFAFQNMVMHEAQQAGFSLNGLFTPNSLVGMMYSSYAQTLERSGNREQAWRAGFDTCFKADNFQSGLTDSMINAFQSAVRYAPIAKQPSFATQGINNNVVEGVVRPFGMAAGILGRTGSENILSEAYYTGITAMQNARLNGLEQQIRDVKSSPLPAPR